MRFKILLFLFFSSVNLQAATEATFKVDAETGKKVWEKTGTELGQVEADWVVYSSEDFKRLILEQCIRKQQYEYAQVTSGILYTEEIKRCQELIDAYLEHYSAAVANGK